MYIPREYALHLILLYYNINDRAEWVDIVTWCRIWYRKPMHTIQWRHMHHDANNQDLNRMAWQWAETLVEIRVTLADIRGTTK